MVKKSTLFNILQYLFFSGLGILLLYLAFRSIDYQSLLNSLLTTRFDYLLISLAFGLLGMLGRSYRWVLMIEPLGYRVHFISAYHALMIGYTANYAFPRIGEITRCGVLNRTEKIPADALIGTVIAERAWDVIMLGILTVTVILFKLKTFGKFFHEKIAIPLSEKFHWLVSIPLYGWLLVIILVVSAILLVLMYRHAIKEYLLRGKIGQFSYGIYQGIKSVLKLKRGLQFIGVTFFIWLVYILMTFFALKAMTPTHSLNFIDAFFIMVVGSYGFVVPVQGGIGTYHAIVALGLSLYAVSWNDALAYALLSHGSQAISIILLGLLSMLTLALRKKTTR
ncbi:MAG TPA: lysylphosphatidylglycerol synthase transmembrane domain-containing protein [Bacteroidales bacterium]|nr:lysylphosphatidylglycerol synthase transmembrane domain-containing protein [Bacteroidales bacterium]HOK99666.1 lysylphosphatidylglycerol synthase transmembrane domain-containing protein [Bacteroidales bacterium]HPO66134.1 lysylphosphatidylglycerol synthase transmembrane domain-containing protein [Bacteroidales bacterium]